MRLAWLIFPQSHCGFVPCVIDNTQFPTCSKDWDGMGLDAEGVPLTVFKGRCQFPGELWSGVCFSARKIESGQDMGVD